MPELHCLGITELAPKLKRREVSSTEVTSALLDRIERLDPQLHSYALVTRELALAQAHAADAAIGRGDYKGPLQGVPVAVKDLCYTAGIPTAAGMPLHRGFKPDFDATVVARLREAGAVLLGKLQMTEGAFGAHHPDITAPVNPWDAARWPGVSSSGSGVATAAGLCYASLGSDTGGSIRFPSTMNGVTGLKPTWGRVSRYGIFPLAESMDHIGPIARNAADCAIVLSAIAGPDANDPTALHEPVPGYERELARGMRGLRFGVDRVRNAAWADADMVRAVEDAARVMQSLGASVREIDLPPSFEAMAKDWYSACAVETALAHESTFPSQAAAYGPVLKGLIEIGRSLPAIDLERIRLRRARFTGELATLMTEIDLLLVPVMHSASPTLAHMASKGREPAEIESRMRFTAPFDMSGTPTLTLPGGVTDSGLPIGFQIAGPRLAEATALRAGHAFQQVTDWHRRRPPV